MHRTMLLVLFLCVISVLTVTVPNNTDWSNLYEIDDFAKQSDVLLHSVRMPRAAVQQFTMLLDDLRHQLLKIWPDFKIWTFGSLANGLALLLSDIDVFITFPDTVNATVVVEQRLVNQAAEILEKNSTFTGIVPSNSSLLLLTFVHAPTNQTCDLKFQINHNEVETRLLNYWIRSDSRVLPLIIIVKYWTNLHGLVLKRLMPNIVWTSLVIFYLQQVNILPSIYSLQKSVETKIEHHWNYNFEESFVYLYYSGNNDSLYKLLGEFFYYYANFDFENNVISIHSGTVIPRAMFTAFEKLPEVFELYKNNIRNNHTNAFVTDGFICLQRLFELNKNMPDDKMTRTKHVAIITKLKKYLNDAAEIFKNENEKYFLAAIMTM